MSEPLTDERLAEIRHDYWNLRGAPYWVHVRDLLVEVDRHAAREEREKKSEASKERAGVVADHLVKVLAEAGVKVDASLHGVIPGGSHWTVRLTVRDVEALYEELTGKGGER